MKKFKIAVTGGIGSGKSEVCNVFKKKGYSVLSSDEIAKELMISSHDIKEKIIKSFGEESYKDGNLNKEYLAKKVFSDPDKNNLINSLVHPATTKEVQLRLDKELNKSNLAFVESALIYEANIEKYFDYVILVFSPDEEKVKRVVARDKVKVEKVIERMNNQISDEEKCDHADFVIKNDSSLEDLRNRAELILNIIESLSAN